MEQELRNELREVLSVFWNEVRDDFRSCDRNQRVGHIFTSMVRLDNYLNGTNYSPQAYVSFSDGYEQVAEEE